MAQILLDHEASISPELYAVPEITLTDEEIERFFDEVHQTSQQTSFKSPPELIGTEYFGGGYVERYGYVDHAGYARAGLVGIPTHAETEIPAISTPAWLTSTEGHNLHTGLKFLDNGVPFIISGAEGSYRPAWWKIRPPKTGINLANSGASLLHFSGHIAAEHPHIIHPTDREIIGESRGGMVAMAAIALASSIREQNIVMADLTAPCFPRGLSKEDLLSFKDQLLAEPKTMVGLAGKMALRLLVHYPQTVDLHPISLLHQLALAPALFSGEAGDAGRLIDGDPLIHVTCFDDDYASMPDEWRDILAEEEHDNRRITILKGSHLTIADPETLRYIIARNQAYRLLQESGITGAYNKFPGILLPKPEEPLSGANVFDLAHHFAEAGLQQVA